MTTHSVTAAALLAFASMASASPHETQTFAGPYGILGEGNPLNPTLSATYTGIDGGTPYEADGLYLVLDLTANGPITFGRDTMIRVTPPGGAAFVIRPTEEYLYDTLTDIVVDVPIPFGVTTVGAWTFSFYQTFEFDGSIPDAYVSNVRLSLQDLPPVEHPETVADIGVLAGGSVTQTLPDYSGADVLWYKFTLPQGASPETGFYVDADTIGTAIGPGNSGLFNDTMMALFDSTGFLYAQSDDIYDDSGEVFMAESWLSFGDQTPRSHDGNPLPSAGADGSLIAGDYYLAAGAFYMQFSHGFSALMDSTSPGGSMQVNIYSNFETTTPCSAADLGVAGGGTGHDSRLDNNDFIAFITLFFANNAAADIGVAGGLPGSDGAWNNNDFIAFIAHFFSDQAACAG